MPKISIIVPVYNVEKYLPFCIDSVLGQTFSDLELILVDDGSADDSGGICDNYLQKDPRVRVIHKKNGGVSSARNEGLAMAQGEYIGFIDGDDFISADMYETLYELIRENNADVAVCGITDYYSDKDLLPSNENNVLLCDRTSALELLLKGGTITASPCTKLIRRELLDELCFSTDYHYGEDAFFLVSLFFHVNNVVVTTKPCYYYRHRMNSITTTPYRPYTFDLIKVYRSIYGQIEKKYPSLLGVAEYRLLWSYFTVFDHMLLSQKSKKDADYKEVLSFLKKNWKKAVLNRHLGNKRRFAAIMLKLNVKFYVLLFHLSNKRHVCE